MRQALMSTPHGRVPFLIPIEHTSSGFYFEVKDEAQRLLASGSGDFRRWPEAIERELSVKGRRIKAPKREKVK